MLKVRWSQLIGVNLLYLVFWIPAIVWTVMNLSVINGMGMAEESQYARADYLSVMSVWLLGLVPCITITGPFNAGVTYVLRNWARDQHSFILSDFWDAVKGNWKQALALLYLLFVPAFNKLITVSYANWLCETYLNPRIEGAQTNIGLRPENWDDTEYRPEDDE